MSRGVSEVKSPPLKGQQELYGTLKKKINWSLNGVIRWPSEWELILPRE